MVKGDRHKVLHAEPARVDDHGHAGHLGLGLQRDELDHLVEGRPGLVEARL